MYDAINSAGTGLQTYHTWLDVIANNIANVNDTSAPTGKVFEQHYMQAGEITSSGSDIGKGVTNEGVTVRGGNGYLTYDPSNALADKSGYVRHTDVDLSSQMGDMILAQRAFQANANVVDRATEIDEAAIAIGKGL